MAFNCRVFLVSVHGTDCVFPTFLSPKFSVPFPESERTLLKFSSLSGPVESGGDKKSNV